MMKKGIVIFTVFAALVLFLGTTDFFGSSSAGEYGNKFKEKDIIPIGELTASPEKYMGKTIVVKGELFDVCQDMGCWFSIKDRTGAIYIDLNMGIKFTLPKKSNGYKAVVMGKVTNEGGKTALKLKGQGVKILEK
jgi:hypothetical protein